MNLFKFCKHSKITIEVFDPCLTLSKINNKKIIIYNFKKIDEYHYSFITHNKNVLIIKELFKSATVEYKIGIINIFIHNLLRVSTIVSLIFSICLFYFMNTMIMEININGDSSSLVEVVNQKLTEKHIEKYSIRKTNDELLIIEKEIAIELYDLIEWIEIKNYGLKVNVNFIKRRESFEKINSKKAIYATKCGIIKKFDIEKGLKMVEINDYVVPGQLLINGYIEDSKHNELFIGAIGRVYAYTWLNISANMEIIDDDKTSTYLHLEEKVKQEVDKQLTGDDEYIESQNLIKFEIKNNIGYLYMHYTLVEDITR